MPAQTKRARGKSGKGGTLKKTKSTGGGKRKASRLAGAANTTYKVWTHGMYQMNASYLTGSPGSGPLAGPQGYGNFWSYAVGVSLANVTQAKQLCQVFERVKVHKMIVEVFPIADCWMGVVAGPTAGSATATNNQANDTWAQGTGACQAQTYPLIAGYVDIDDIGTTTPNPTSILAHPDAWPKPFNKVYKRTFVPGLTTQIETTGVTAASGGTIRSNTLFLNTNTAQSAQLSGFKFAIWIPLSGTSAQCSVTVQVAVHLLCEFQGLNYPSQPDRIARLLSSLQEAQQAITEEHLDGEDDEPSYSKICPVHRRVHSDERICA